MVGLIIFLVVAIPVFLVLVWMLLADAFVRVDPGQLGLVVVRGKASDRSLLPGPHFVPRLWRMSVVSYPSLELSFRAGDRDLPKDEEGSLERAGPPLRVLLGDRATLELAYTVRFRLEPTVLKDVHERFGTDGIWSAVRDSTARAVRATLCDPEVGIDDFFGDARRGLEETVSEAVSASLAEDGFTMTLFSLGDIDLGRTGEVIQATVRARLELEREQAEVATRLAEVKADAELSEYVAAAATDAALRYRELNVWRDVISSPIGGSMMAAAAGRQFGPNPTGRPEGTAATETGTSNEGNVEP